ncbi:PAS domain S-box-containing protein [Azospirillum fermentarium]|uniref:PAS domain-containing sensor histidine kinase n=1 Tax=Azospirillum fermentarium TaxID=1233114 RepID=UPI0022276FE8|nr:PAS-domain containing protein [Azospirillum fermentarium]MCW2246262.1 PAS domain S-box-containing protein [Azospirillum fermentarium]
MAINLPGAAAWHRIPSVSGKFLAVLVPVLLLGSLAFSAGFFVLRHRTLTEDQTRRMAVVAESHAAVLAAVLDRADHGAARTILQAIAAHPDTPCAETGGGAPALAWPPGGCPAGGRLERVRVPLPPGGTLTLGVSMAAVDERIRSGVHGALVLLGLILGGTVATALAAHRISIARPLRRMIEAMQPGGAGRPVAWESADELGRVVAAYNATLARLHAEEEALRQSQERLTLAIGATRSAVWDHDLITGRCWWSPEFPRLLGMTPEDLPMTPASRAALIHPGDAPEVLRATERHILGETESLAVTYRVRRSDGAWLWLEERATAVRGADGIAHRLTGTVSDVTERVRAEQALEREHTTLQITLDNVEQGIVMADAGLRVVMSNRRAADLLNVPADFLAAGPTYAEVIRRQQDNGEFADDAGDPDLHLDEWPEGTRQPMAFKRRCRNGAVVEVRSTPLAGGGFVRTFRDVTEEARKAEEIFDTMLALEEAYANLKDTQASLVQAEKMASLALLVAGIAHEINTPVGVAYGCSTHLEGQAGTVTDALAAGGLKRSTLESFLHDAGNAARLIRQNLERAAGLIQSFKRVAVDQTSQDRRRFALVPYLTEVAASLDPSLHHLRSRVAVDGPAADPVAMDSFPGALSQIVTNIVMNADVHAFGPGGPGEPERLAIHVAALAGDEVEIRFHDNGRGIPPAHLARVFDPFFTTRRGEGGSGLGLHIVFNLVTQTLGGRITVDSPPGGGTTFTLRLPRTAPVLDAVSRQPEPLPA